jgi:transglutaminase-like putative cysteine protease
MTSNPATTATTTAPDLSHSNFVIDSDFGFRASGLRLPPSLLAAFLTALATAVFTTYKFPGATIVPIASAALLLATRFTPLRVPRTAPYRYGLRFLAVTLVFLVHGLPATNGGLSFFEPEYTRLAASILAAELAVRAWLRTDPARLPRERRMFLLITALIMTAASNTYDRMPFHLLAPLYTLAVAFALRTLAFDSTVAHASPRAFAHRLPLHLLRTLAFLLTLLLGATTVLAVTKYDNVITTWAFNLLRNTRPTPRASAIGFSTAAPRLGPVFNPDATLDRALLIQGPPGDCHLRILAFDTYDHTAWRPAIAYRNFKSVPRHLTATAPPTTAPAHTLRITRLTDLADLLPVPTGATAVRINADLDRDALAALRDRTGGENPPFDVMIPAHPPAVDTVPLAPPAVLSLGLLLALPPEIDPRVIALARQLTTADTTPAHKIFHLAQHLRGSHAYSLSFQPSGNTDPLNDFILNGRAAHCQYFASAMVILARAAGVPARLVTGYYAHEPYGDDATIVRERDAHAWAECYLGDVGQWVTVDATPSAGRPDGLFPDPPRWRRFLESLRDLPTRLREWFATIPRPRLYTTLTLAAAAILLIALARNVKLRRSPTPPKDRYPAPAPENHDAATLTPTNPTMIAFLTSYEAARFGPPTEGLITELQTRLAQLEQSRLHPEP